MKALLFKFVFWCWRTRCWFRKAGFHTVYATDVWDVACETPKEKLYGDS